ncbi:ribosomal protein S18-alanine N-acetyltransferase [bacterium]|nr:ribosomal protein S18-alanine N-acetyltransferase [bacterium]
MSAKKVRVRAMTRADLDGVCTIEEENFPAPWPRSSFESDIAKGVRSLCLVAESGSVIVGYLISWPVADELHIGNLAVAAGCWDRGVGTALLREGLEEASAAGAVLATLEVRASNARAIALYERHGFRPVAIRKGYYNDSGEDAVVMMADLGA